MFGYGGQTDPIFGADSRFFFLVDCRGKKKSYGKKSSKSVKLFKSYDFAEYTIEVGQLLLIKVAGCISNNVRKSPTKIAFQYVFVS